jgi:hypothetical protein
MLLVYPKKQMIMIAHQHPGVTFKTCSQYTSGKIIEKFAAIVSIGEYISALDTTSHDVMKCSGRT